MCCKLCTVLYNSEYWRQRPGIKDVAPIPSGGNFSLVGVSALSILPALTMLVCNSKDIQPLENMPLACHFF